MSTDEECDSEADNDSDFEAMSKDVESMLTVDAGRLHKKAELAVKDAEEERERLALHRMLQKEGSASGSAPTGSVGSAFS